jgi:hypothetical protein
MGDNGYVKPDAAIDYDLATMQERLGWPRLRDPDNSDDVRNYRTECEEMACLAIFNATDRSWGHYPKIPPLEFFAQSEEDLALFSRWSGRIEPEEALALFSDAVKMEAGIKRQIVEGSVIRWCPMCLDPVAPQEPVCLSCNVNLEPVLRPRRLLAYPTLKVDCAVFINELHQISRKRNKRRRH